MDVALGSFHVMVGPNASGKSTLFDVVTFLSDLVSEGLEVAVGKRTDNFLDLVWQRSNESKCFELAVEFEIPKRIRDKLSAREGHQIFRYEVSIQEDSTNGISIASERGILAPKRVPKLEQPSSFPEPLDPLRTILSPLSRKNCKTILRKSDGKDYFYIEKGKSREEGWLTGISLGPHRSALGNFPEDPAQFPVATYVKRILGQRVTPLFLDGQKMRRASPPALRWRGSPPDGSNLPWAIQLLRKRHERLYKRWLEHVKTVLVDLEDILVIERKDDRHAYLQLVFNTGVQIPSWMASDGTLRLLALTLLAYLPDTTGIYLVEEPENGIHPMAIYCLCQSLSSVYESQILLATHSPTVLRYAELEQILCFANKDGATAIIQGDQHPRLRDWKEGQPNTDLLFARGVYG